jgi:molecular chaperone GrpE
MAQVADASAAPGTVLEVLQEGYRLRDRLLRPARVVVARPPEGPEGRG